MSRFFLKKLILTTLLFCSGCFNDAANTQSASDIANVPPDLQAQKLTEGLFKNNFVKRREYGWGVLERVFTPVQGHPLWITWYSKKEVSEIISLFFEKIKLAGTNLDVEKLAENALNDFSKKTVAQRMTTDRVAALLPQFDTIGPVVAKKERQETFALEPDTHVESAPHGGSFYSPILVKHLLVNFREIAKCNPRDPSTFSKSPINKNAKCLAAEFPENAVMVKARFDDVNSDVYTANTSSGGLLKLFRDNTGVEGDGNFFFGPLVKGDSSSAYSVKTKEGKVFALRALHVSTKELPAWSWVSAWWEKDATGDWGEDRPEKLNGKYGLGNFKMCVVTDFQEGDENAHVNLPDGLSNAVYALRQVSGGTQWCANPRIETNFGKSNCIGCHQFAGVKRMGHVRKLDTASPLVGDFVHAFLSFQQDIAARFKTLPASAQR